MKGSGPIVGSATLEDLLAIPEDHRRHELVEGQIVERGAATGEHGAAQFTVAGFTGPFNRRSGGRWPGGWWCGISVDIYFDPANTLCPDVAGWRRDRVSERLQGLPVRVRPDWVCEILSTNRRYDVVKKKRVYQRFEVPYYWIVDPAEETLSVLRWSQDGYVEILTAERSETVRAEPFEAMPLQVGIFFGDDEKDDEPAQEE